MVCNDRKILEGMKWPRVMLRHIAKSTRLYLDIIHDQLCGWDQIELIKRRKRERKKERKKERKMHTTVNIRIEL